MTDSDSADTPKVYVLHENEDWLSPLRIQLDKLKVDYEEWFLDERHESSFDFSSPPPEGVFYNRMSASSHTRGHRYSPELAACVISWLEAHDRVVVNSSQALELEVSKIKQYAAFRRHGIQTPKTMVVSGKRNLVAFARRMPTPFITKHNRAGKGLGIHLFRDMTQFEQYIESADFEDSVDGITLLQEYIESPDEYITRAEFVNGKFLYALKIRTRSGEFENCPADSCELPTSLTGFCPLSRDTGEQGPSKRQKVQKVQEVQKKSYKFSIRDEDLSDHEVVTRVPALMKDRGIGVCGVEFIKDKNDIPYAFDLNTNTNYNLGAEQRAGRKDDTSGMGAIALFLKNTLDALVDGQSNASPN